MTEWAFAWPEEYCLRLPYTFSSIDGRNFGNNKRAK